MYANNMKMKKAIQFGKKCRSAINPIGSFPELLGKLEKALAKKGLYEKVRKKVDVKKDLKLIHEKSKRF